MLLIAVSGAVGSGKTTLLRSLAEWWKAEGKEPEGFLAIAGERLPTGHVESPRGALRYDLLLLKRSLSLPFAVRDDSLRPPYRFCEETSAVLERWADELGGTGVPSLLIIDELGPVEAAGGGHMRLWERIASARPEVVAVAVRRNTEAALEQQFGRRFDLRIDAGSPDALEQLKKACLAHSDWVRVGIFGGGAGGFEASVGAILHGTQVPLRGLFLSSMQSVIMTYAANGLERRQRVVWVAFLSASLKAFSPAGNRLRPMLAIAVQGILYVLGLTLLGWNAVGVGLGGFLVGAWSALQGVALQYLFVGNQLVQTYDAVIHWIAAQLHVGSIGFVALISGWTVLCGLLSAALTLAAWLRRQRMPGRLRMLMFRKPRGVTVDGAPATFLGALRHGMKDVARPWFWVPVAIVVTVMLVTGSPLESALWVVIRAASVGFLLFSLVRAFDAGRFIAWLQNRGYWGPALAYRRAMDHVRTADRPAEPSTKQQPERSGDGPRERPGRDR